MEIIYCVVTGLTHILSALITIGNLYSICLVFVTMVTVFDYIWELRDPRRCLFWGYNFWLMCLQNLALSRMLTQNVSIAHSVWIECPFISERLIFSQPPGQKWTKKCSRSRLPKYGRARKLPIFNPSYHWSSVHLCSCRSVYIGGVVSHASANKYDVACDCESESLRF